MVKRFPKPKVQDVNQERLQINFKLPKYIIFNLYFLTEEMAKNCVWCGVWVYVHECVNLLVSVYTLRKLL